MSWFGFGGSSKGNEDKEQSVAPSSDFSQSSSFNDSSTQFAAPSSSSSTRSSAFEQELALEQQKAMVQTVMLKLTEISFDKCITKPSSSLSSSEQSCIAAVVGKYLDTSEHIVGKFMGGQGH
jgi:hypothetical protein